MKKVYENPTIELIENVVIETAEGVSTMNGFETDIPFWDL